MMTMRENRKKWDNSVFFMPHDETIRSIFSFHHSRDFTLTRLENLLHFGKAFKTFQGYVESNWASKYAESFHNQSGNDSECSSLVCLKSVEFVESTLFIRACLGTPESDQLTYEYVCMLNTIEYQQSTQQSLLSTEIHLICKIKRINYVILIHLIFLDVH